MMRAQLQEQTHTTDTNRHAYNNQCFVIIWKELFCVERKQASVSKPFITWLYYVINQAETQQCLIQ